MAGYRQIHTQIWKDEWFIELEPLEKMLFIYLFSNEMASIAGIYKIPMKVISNETGIEIDAIRMMLDKFSNDGKIMYQEGVLWVVNMRQYHYTKSPRTLERIKKDIDAIPDGEVKKAYQYHAEHELQGMDTVSIPYRYPIDTVSIPHSKSLIKSLTEIEIEKESVIENETVTTTTTTPTTIDDEPVGILRPLAQAFTECTHLPEGSGGHLWVEGLQKLYEMGASPGDITLAVAQLTGKNYTISSPVSLINAVANVMRIREERKPTGETGINKYLRGYADHIKH
jgi:hypothetical protein